MVDADYIYKNSRYEGVSVVTDWQREFWDVKLISYIASLNKFCSGSSRLNRQNSKPGNDISKFHRQ